MPRRYPLASRLRTVEFPRMREKPVTEIAADFGISDRGTGCARRSTTIAAASRCWACGVRRTRAAAMGGSGGETRERDHRARNSAIRSGESRPATINAFIAERYADLPIAVRCRIWRYQPRAPSSGDRSRSPAAVRLARH